MSITKRDPNTIFLGGERTQVNDLAASEAITPGMLVERVDTAGVFRWKKQVTASIDVVRAVATEQLMMNLGVDDAYAADDLVEVSIGQRGSTFWMLIASGQNITAGNFLESAGGGYLKAFSAGVKLFQALESKPNVLADTRIRVEVV